MMMRPCFLINALTLLMLFTSHITAAAAAAAGVQFSQNDKQHK
jgi:hypothetical protein